MQLSNIVVDNYFKTGHNRNALLSYVIYPFLKEIESYHSNNQECFAMAEVLKELEFNVDVIHWDNTTFIPMKKYDIVIDNHNNLERLSPFLSAGTRKIFHATNAHWLYQNLIEYDRHYNFL